MTTLQGPRTADMRDKLGTGLALSPDAASVRFGLGYGGDKPVVFDLASASLTDSSSVPPKFLTAKVDGLRVTDWEDNYAPKFDGAKLALDDFEKSRALAVRPEHPASASARIGTFAPMTRRARSAGSGGAPASDGASTSPPTAKPLSPHTGTARFAGCGGRTAKSCLPSSLSPRAANGLPGRQVAITWLPPEART